MTTPLSPNDPRVVKAIADRRQRDAQCAGAHRGMTTAHGPKATRPNGPTIPATAEVVHAKGSSR